jgi:hypothetical protein
VLPRAYVRHTPVSTRTIAREPLAPDVEEERPLEVVIEPAPTPSPVVAVGGPAVRERVPQESVPQESVPQEAVSPVAAPATLAPGIVALEAVAPEAPAPKPLASDVPSAQPPTMESVRDRTVSAEDAARNDVLARVRRQAQRPTRVLVHDAPPQRGRRFIGSLTFFVATAVVVVGLLVVLAVLARRSPGFPF